MSDTVHNPHDKLFTEAFSRKESAVAFLQGYLPDDVKALVDFDSYTRYPGSFVDEELRAHSSDLIYQFTCNNRPAFLYILHEHQSKREPMMAWRLIKYMVKLWSALLKDQPEIKQLPPIIPMVLYQGKPEWNAALQFQDLVDNDNPALKRYIPRFEYLLVDLVQQDDKAIYSDIYGRLVLYLMKAYATGTLLPTLERNGAMIADLLSQSNAHDLLETLFRYIMSVDDIDITTLHETVAHTVNRETGDMLMTLAERLEAKGRKEGQEEGQKVGERRLLQTQWKLKFPNHPPANLDAFTLEQLDIIGGRLLTCNTPEEVLQGIATE